MWTMNDCISESSVALELQDEIGQDEALIGQLSERRTILRRKINTLAPISLLPHEILLEVFLLVFQPEPQDSTSHEPGSSTTPPPATAPRSHTPLFLDSVCVAWRNLAWNTPLLWRTVNINVSLSTTHQARLLSERFPSSRTVPLRITLFLRGR